MRRLQTPAARNALSRAGFTLTQLLVVIALIGVITTVAISIIITMLQLEGRTVQVWLTQESLRRLAEDFREDAHAAKTAEIRTQNDSPTMIFRSGTPTTSVTYVATENQVVRRETDGDKLLRTESYQVPEATFAFQAVGSNSETTDLKPGQLVNLTCLRPNVEAINRRTPAPRHEEHILAELGRDHRFVKSPRP